MDRNKGVGVTLHFYVSEKIEINIAHVMYLKST